MEKDKNQSQQGKQYNEVDKMYAHRHPQVHKEEHTAHHHSHSRGKIILPHESEPGNPGY